MKAKLPGLNAFLSGPFGEEFAHDPLRLVDVGARGGIDPRWQAVRDILQVEAFEPEPEECARLNTAQSATNRHIRYHPTALYRASGGSSPMHVTRSGGCSSFFEPNMTLLNRYPKSDRFSVERIVTVATQTLDQIHAAQPFAADFIKIDVQGAELAVLEGADRVLDESVSGLEIEVEFSELYQGQPLFGDLDMFLRKKGFILFDLKRHWWKRAGAEQSTNARGQLMFGEALYLKDYIATPEALEKTPARSSRRMLLGSALIATLYQKFDFAAELIRFGRQNGWLDVSSANPLLRQLSNPSLLGRTVAGIPGRFGLSRCLIRLGQRLQASQWAASDDGL